MTETAERIVLASRPVGEPTLDNFRLEKLPIPQPEPGLSLLKSLSGLGIGLTMEIATDDV
jgi:NADPH-dependent curcumin reductase CurA